MKETGVLFRPELVRALLHEVDPKTVTRRLQGLEGVNQDLDPELLDSWSVHWSETGHAGPAWYFYCDEYRDEGSLAVTCPYGVPGDRIWVRETWRPRIAHGHGEDACDCADVVVRYDADGEERFFRDEEIPNEWTMPKAAARSNVSPLFLPRWASRLVLEVTSVRVERLQDISEEDAKAEGVERRHDANHPAIQPSIHNPCTRAFATLWDKINGKPRKTKTGIKPAMPWSSNPWLWVIEFRRVDEKAKAA